MSNETVVDYETIKERVHALADEHRKHAKDGGLWEAYIKLADATYEYIKEKSSIPQLAQQKEANAKASYKRLAVAEVVWRVYEKNKENHNIKAKDVKEAILQGIVPFNDTMFENENRRKDRFADLYDFDKHGMYQKKAKDILSEMLKEEDRDVIEQANNEITMIGKIN